MVSFVFSIYLFHLTFIGFFFFKKTIYACIAFQSFTALLFTRHYTRALEDLLQMLLQQLTRYIFYFSDMLYIVVQIIICAGHFFPSMSLFLPRIVQFPN